MTESDEVKSGVRSHLDGHPLVAIVGVSVTVAVTVAGVMRYVHSKQLKVIEARNAQETTELKKKINRERSEIKFRLKDQSGFLTKKSIFIDHADLVGDYRIFEEGFAVLRTPISEGWEWEEKTELELIRELIQGPQSDSDGVVNILARNLGDSLAELASNKTVHCAQKKEHFPVLRSESAGADMRLHFLPRVCFEFASWEVLRQSLRQTEESGFGLLQARLKQYKEDNAELSSRINERIDLISREMLRNSENMLQHLADGGAPKSEVEEYLDASSLGRAMATLYCTHFGRIEAFLLKLEHEISDDFAERLRLVLREEMAARADDICKCLSKSEDLVSELSCNGTEESVSSDSQKLPSNRELFAGYFNLKASPMSLFSELGEYKPTGLHLADKIFVIHGHVEVKSDLQIKPSPYRLYMLRVGVRTPKGIYLARYLIPTKADAEDVRTGMSLVNGFRVVR